MKKIFINISQMSEQQEIHEYLAKQFNFPDYYGKNLDALFDCLTSITTPTAVLAVINAQDEYHKKIKNVLDDAQEENKNFGVFWIN